MRTALCDLLGIDVPIVQAPIGGAAVPELAAAVSNAGALGMVALTGGTAEEIQEEVETTRGLTDRPFGGNFILEDDQRVGIAAALEAGVRIISLFWGDPAAYAPLVHEAEGVLLVTVGSVEEARHSVDAGADVVVAQGWEAGGHVRGQVSTLALIPRVVDAVSPTPVVAAGGIADGRGLAAVLMLGAAGAWLGTRFVVAEEAPTHPVYRQRVLEASEGDTIWLADLFSGGWENAPHRVIRNSTGEAWESAGRPAWGDPALEADVIARGQYGEIRRYDSRVATNRAEGEIEAMPLWAGQGVGLVTREQPAGEIVHDLVDELNRTLGSNAWNPDASKAST
jgi:nitronate monooxygenase